MPTLTPSSPLAPLPSPPPHALPRPQEEARARDLFYGLWIPDLFMRRVQDNAQWSLFCPNEAPGLADCWGEEFEALYTKYEREVSTQAG